LYWYDPQPHPDDPSLASTFPHHKHAPPQIRRNRTPAPGSSFEHPNLDFLVKEIERELLGSKRQVQDLSLPCLATSRAPTLPAACGLGLTTVLLLSGISTQRQVSK